jgi:hypothetical protein
LLHLDFHVLHLVATSTAQLDGYILDVLTGAACFVDLRAGLVRKWVISKGTWLTRSAVAPPAELAVDWAGCSRPWAKDFNPVLVLVIGAFTRNTINFQKCIKSHLFTFHYE